MRFPARQLVTFTFLNRFYKTEMTKNPLINALAALAYIALVVLIMFYGPEEVGPTESIVMPIAMLSLFVLSVAVMGYVFFSWPMRLYLDGQKGEGIVLFLKTLGIFAIATILLVLTNYFVGV